MKLRIIKNRFGSTYRFRLGTETPYFKKHKDGYMVKYQGQRWFYYPDEVEIISI